MHDCASLSVETCSEFLKILQQRNETTMSRLTVLTLTTESIHWTEHLRTVVTDRPGCRNHRLRRRHLTSPSNIGNQSIHPYIGRHFILLGRAHILSRAHCAYSTEMINPNRNPNTVTLTLTLTLTDPLQPHCSTAAILNIYNVPKRVAKSKHPIHQSVLF